MEHNLERFKEMNKVSDTVWENSNIAQKACWSQQGFTRQKKLLDEMDNGVFNQVTNVACLPVNSKVFVLYAGWALGILSKNFLIQPLTVSQSAV